jgi:outer membrane receptor protein involved in Fe transport
LEAGYRLQSGQRWSFDLSGFWSYYNRMRTESSPTAPTVRFSGNSLVFLMPLTIDNAGAGRSYGGEISGAWQVSEHWRLIPSYSYLNEARWRPQRSPYFSYWWDGTPATLPHQVLLRSQHDLFRSLKLDLMARAWSRDKANCLPGAFLLDARVAWRPTRAGELSFAVQDLANHHVLEAYPEIASPSIPIRRTFVVKWMQRF